MFAMPQRNANARRQEQRDAARGGAARNPGRFGRQSDVCRDDHHGAFRRAQDAAGYAANKELVEGAVAVRTHDDQIGMMLRGLIQDLVDNRTLDMEREDFLTLDGRYGPKFVESLVFLAEVARHRGADGQWTRFKANEVRFGFADVKQDEFRAVSARHAPGCIEDACGNVGEIDGYENGFHRLLRSGSNLA